MRIVNLYHHLSRAMWYDLESKKLITGEDAKALTEKINEYGYKDTGFLEIEEGVKADVWGDGKPRPIYGRIYELP